MREIIDNIKTLHESRLKQGLTQKELSQLSGVAVTQIHRYENGVVPSVKNYNKLARVLGCDKIPVQASPKTTERKTLKELDSLLTSPEPVKIPKPITFTFTEAHIYKIYAEVRDEEYAFRYEGKQGIHHMFREIRGGWSRTFTDAQLIGKKIVEVNKNEED